VCRAILYELSSVSVEKKNVGSLYCCRTDAVNVSLFITRKSALALKDVHYLWPVTAGHRVIDLAVTAEFPASPHQSSCHNLVGILAG